MFATCYLGLNTYMYFSPHLISDVVVKGYEENLSVMQTRIWIE